MERRGQAKTKVSGKGLKELLKSFGPGVITGASDDDPSGIGTYTQVGAQFRFGLLWVTLISLPCMVAIQAACDRLGRMTGKGLAENLKVAYPKWLVYSMAALLVTANTINLGADLGAMGQSMRLLVKAAPSIIYAAAFGAIAVSLQIFLEYRTYRRILMLLCLSLFAYLGSVFALQIPWSEAISQTFVPRFQLSSDYIMGAAAILGTNISPFMFFWQAGERVEEVKTKKGIHPTNEHPEEREAAARKINLDTVAGMTFNIIISWFVILTCGLALHDKGIRDINQATQAAQALRPIVGNLSSVLFAFGMIGTGMLAVPILAGSSAYALGACFGFKAGFRHGFKDAKAFYGVLGLITALGLSLNLIGINPMKALVYSAVINSVVAVPLMAMILRLGRMTKIARDDPFPTWLWSTGWAAAAIMALSGVAMALAAVFRRGTGAS